MGECWQRYAGLLSSETCSPAALLGAFSGDEIELMLEEAVSLAGEELKPWQTESPDSSCSFGRRSCSTSPGSVCSISSSSSTPVSTPLLQHLSPLDLSQDSLA